MSLTRLFCRLNELVKASIVAVKFVLIRPVRLLRGGVILQRVYIPPNAHTCTHTCKCIHTRTHTHARVHACTHARTHTPHAHTALYL